MAFFKSKAADILELHIHIGIIGANPLFEKRILLISFQDAFDHEAAKKAGAIHPVKGR